MECKASGEFSLLFERQLKFYISPDCKLFYAIYLILLDFCHFEKLFLCSMSVTMETMK